MCGIYRNNATPIKTRTEGDPKAAMYAIEALLKIGIKKICINTTQTHFLSKIKRLNILKERHFIKPQNGQRYKEADIFKQMDKLLRDNNNVKIMWKYAPEGCSIDGVTGANELAKTVFTSKI